MYLNLIRESNVFHKVEIKILSNQKRLDNFFNTIDKIAPKISLYFQTWFYFDNEKSLKLILKILKRIMKKNPRSFFDIILVTENITYELQLNKLNNLNSYLKHTEYLKTYRSYRRQLKHNSDQLLITFISPNLSKFNSSGLNFLYITSYDKLLEIGKNRDNINIFIDVMTLKNEDIIKIFKKLVELNYRNVLWNHPLLMKLFVSKFENNTNNEITQFNSIYINTEGRILSNPNFNFKQIDDYLNHEFQINPACEKCSIFELCKGINLKLTSYPNCETFKELVLKIVNINKINY